MWSIIFEINVLVIIFICFQIYLLMDHHCKTQSELSDLLKKDRIYWTFPRFILQNINTLQLSQIILMFGINVTKQIEIFITRNFSVHILVNIQKYIKKFVITFVSTVIFLAIPALIHWLIVGCDRPGAWPLKMVNARTSKFCKYNHQ